MSNKVINVSKVINKFEIKLVNADQELKFRDINLPSIHRLGLEIAGIINNKRYSDNVYAEEQKNHFILKLCQKMILFRCLDVYYQLSRHYWFCPKGF